jgi:hypothetical protein
MSNTDLPIAQEIAFNQTASAVIKLGGGVVHAVSVLAAGTSVAIHDCATTGAAAAGNQIANIPTTTLGTYVVNLPFLTGLVIVPTGGTLAIGYR